MTESQLRYQTLLETQRHNLAMENYNRAQVDVSKRSASVAEREATIKEAKLPYEIPLMINQADQYSSQAAKNLFGGAHEFFGAFKDLVQGVSIVGALFS